MAGLTNAPLVRVTWHDAYVHSNDGWKALSEIHDEAQVVYSVGHWHRVPNAKHMILVQTCADDGDVDNVLVIPMKMVRKIERLQIPHKRRKKR
jgi:hypothetical protein